MSKQRDEMLKIIHSMQGHMTADEIYIECKSQQVSISLATIYRNLGILVDQGILRKVSIPGEPDRYDTNLHNHDHIICEDCKKVEDIHLGDITRSIEAEIGSAIVSYDLSIRYVCPACRAKRKEKNYG